MSADPVSRDEIMNMADAISRYSVSYDDQQVADLWERIEKDGIEYGSRLSTADGGSWPVGALPTDGTWVVTYTHGNPISEDAT